MESDSFIPDVFTLESGPVSGIETSATDPKVRLDASGLFNTDPSGNIIDRLSALGLEILADNAAVATPQRSVTWERSIPGGAVVAQVSAAGIGTVNSMSLSAKGGVVRNSTINLITDAGGTSSFIQASTVGAGGAQNKVLIRDDGGSAFMQVPNGAVEIERAGAFASGGTFSGTTVPNQIPNGGGISVTRNGVGDYFINFPSNASLRLLTATLVNPAVLGIPIIVSLSANQIRLFTESNAGALFDCSFWATWFERP